MKHYFYFAIMFVAIITLNSCKKDSVETPFDDVFYKPYTTGIIKFQYLTPTTRNGTSTSKDTIVSFTSIGNNTSEKDEYGYSKPSTPWVQLQRLDPNNFQKRVIIFFVGTNLNALTLPYKFKAGDVQNAQINYVVGAKLIYDNTGNLVYSTDAYAATTYSDDFELTILSRQNNRLQGSYSGVIKKQDGHTIKIDKGLFDIAIVDK